MLREPDFDSRNSDVRPAGAASLLAEVAQVFAEVVAGAEAHGQLSNEQREQAALAIEQAMESTRRMVDRLATAEE